MRGSGTSHSPLALYSIHTSQIAARTPSPACWGRACPLARPGGGAIGRRKTPVVRRAVGAGWGVARCFRTDGNAAARPSPPYITIEARSLPQLRWGRWRGAPDGVRPAAATQVGLQNRQCELASSRPCSPHPIRRHSPSKDGRLSTPYGATFPASRRRGRLAGRDKEMTCVNPVAWRSGRARTGPALGLLAFLALLGALDAFQNKRARLVCIAPANDLDPFIGARRNARSVGV